MEIDLIDKELITINLPSGGSVTIGGWGKLISISSDIHIDDSDPVIITENDLTLNNGTVCTTHKHEVNKSNGYSVLIDTTIYRRKS